MKKRYITALIEQSLLNFPAVLLIGARQVGKSTLAKQLVNERHINQYVTLDNLSELETARTDPDGFLQAYQPDSLALDEIQRVPDMMRALKKTIDENRRPGRFLLTGSANVLSYPGVTESLAGRLDVIHLEGLSIAELSGKPQPSEFIPRLFSHDPIKSVTEYARAILKTSPTLDKSQVRSWVFYGSFPEIAIKKNAPFNQRWFGSYLTTYIERDIRDLAKLIDVINFSKLFRLIALRTANLLNVANVGMDAGLDQRTANRYLQLLELTFQINQLNPWHANTKKRLVKTSKVFMNDSGFACFLAGIDEPNSLEGHAMWGALLETWLWSEIRKQLAQLTGIYPTYYRTHQGREVDFVLEKGSITVGIEIKASASVNPKDFAGLMDMQAATGDKTVGVVLYLGEKVVRFSEKLIAVPLQCLLF